MTGKATSLLVQHANDPDSRLIGACALAARSIAAADGRIAPEETDLLVGRFRSVLSLGEDNASLLAELMSEGSDASYDVDEDVDLVLELVDGLGSAAHLLLFALSAEMAAADDEVDPQELQLIGELGSTLNISPQDQAVLKRAFANQPLTIQVSDATGADLLTRMAPAAFESHGRGVRSLAGHIARTLNQLLESEAAKNAKVRPQSPKAPRSQKSSPSPLRRALEESPLRQELEKTLHKLRSLPGEVFSESQRKAVESLENRSEDTAFRIAVVGMFSSGKSTFLNAMVREAGGDVFPASPIPCTATVNILRHGEQRRYLRRADDGSESEISEEEFRRTIELPPDMEASAAFAIAGADALVVEYPLGLCEGGVELVDSPGLNEHPRRTEITANYLRKADAVILLTNANHLLSEGERQLVQELAKSIKRENLFFAVNFFDQIEPEAREKVEKRARGYLTELFGEPDIVDRRLHFISARQAIIDHRRGQQTEWTERLAQLESDVGRYVGEASGDVRWRRMANDVMRLLVDPYERASSLGATDLSKADREIDEAKAQMVEISRARVQLQKAGAQARATIEGTHRELADELVANFKQFEHEAPGYIRSASEKWTSEASPIFGKSELVEDYRRQFGDEIKGLVQWWMAERASAIIERQISSLLNKLNRQFRGIQHEFRRLDSSGVSTGLDNEDVEGENAFVVFMKGAGGFLSGGPVGALVGSTMDSKDIAINFAANFATGFTLAALGLGGPVTLIAGVAIVGIAQLVMGKDRIQAKIRDRVLEAGLEKLQEVLDDLEVRLAEFVTGQFNELSNGVEAAIESQVVALEHQARQRVAILEEAKSNRARAVEEVEGYQKLAARVEGIARELQTLGTLTWEGVLHEQGARASGAGASRGTDGDVGWTSSEARVSPTPWIVGGIIVVVIVVAAAFLMF